MEENWFGLNRGQMTSVGTKVNSTSQKLLACKISGIFVHWGPFYGTFWWSSLTLLPPLLQKYIGIDLGCLEDDVFKFSLFVQLTTV